MHLDHIHPQFSIPSTPDTPRTHLHINVFYFCNLLSPVSAACEKASLFHSLPLLLHHILQLAHGSPSYLASSTCLSIMFPS